jgi:hypothetical protein
VDEDGAVLIEQGQGLVGREDRLEKGDQGQTGSVLEAEMADGGVFLASSRQDRAGEDEEAQEPPNP